MSEVFISYARSTEPQARAIADALHELGYGVWRDNELPAHRAFAEVIEERLAAAKAVVVVWSAEAAKSEWVQAEADRARQEHKLVQLSVDGVKPPLPFDRLQCADFTSWTGDAENPGWKKVVQSVAELVGRPPKRLRRAPAGLAAASPVASIAATSMGRRRIGLWVWAATALAFVAVGGAVAFWARVPGERAPAPWSDQDIRDTYVLSPVKVTGDPALDGYAEQFSQGVASRFTPARGDPRLWPGGVGPRARFDIELEFRRSKAGVTTRVTLRKQADGEVVSVGEVSDALGPAPSLAAIWHASGFIKPAGIRLEAGLARAKPAAQRDAHDLVLTSASLPRDRDGEAKAVALLDEALRHAPGDHRVEAQLAGRLDDRVTNGWSPNAAADVNRLRNLSAELLRDDPSDYWGLMVTADNYMTEGRWQDCLVAADRVLTVKPDDPFALEDKSQAELAMGAFSDADKTLAELAPFQAVNDEFPYAQYAGKVRLHQGRLANAETLFRKAIQVTPAPELGRPAFAGLRLYLAATEVEEGRLADARADLGQFLAAVPQARRPSVFETWNDAHRFVLTDWPRVRADLTRIGWTGD